MRLMPPRLAAVMPGARAALLALPLLLQACHTPRQIAGTYETTYDQQMARKAYRPALKSIQMAVKTDENEARRWLKLGRVQELLNQYAPAAGSYQHVLDLDPANIEALEGLSLLAVRGGQFDAAKRYIEPLLLLQPNDLTGLLASGAVALHERRYDDADRMAGMIIAGAPTDAEGYVLRARKLELTGHSEQAVALLEQRSRLFPANPDLLQQLMTLYRQRGDRGGVRATALRLMPLFPDDPSYALEGVRAYHATGHEDRARAIIAALTARSARDIGVMLSIARLWTDIAPREEAHDQIAAAAGKTPPRVRAALGDLLTDLGDPARAIAVLAPLATPRVTVGNVDVETAFARALLAAGRKDAGVRTIDAVLAFDGTNPVALVLRARLELARGDFLAAATDAQLVANDDDANAEAALLVAQIYAAQGNQLLAGNAYAQARQKFANSPDVLRAEGLWLLGQQRTADAVRHASEYVETHGGQFAGWQVYRDICAAAHDAACLAAARGGLARFS